MEEHVGQWWHRAITRAADRSHADAAVALDDVRRSVGMMFRAGGGASGVRIAEAADRSHRGPRGWLQRVAGSGTRVSLAELDAQTLALPPRIAVFDAHALNRALYLWLAALAACHDDRGDWIGDNARATLRALEHFPGLAMRHRHLVDAHLATRSMPARREAAAAEQRVRDALRDPAAAVQSHRVAPPDVDASTLQPVWLWLHPSPRRRIAIEDVADADDTNDEPSPTPRAAPQDTRRRHAERVAEHRDRAPLVLPFRAESLLSVAELVKVNRSDDDRETDDASSVADDLDTIAVAPDGRAAASRVKFDLDLPSAAHDDLPLGDGHRLPEWDWRSASLVPDHCAVQVLVARRTTPLLMSPALRLASRQVRRRLAALRTAPRLVRGLPEGEMLDVDAWVRFQGERRGAARHSDAPPIMARHVRGERSLATLLLADLSLSTESPIGRAHGDRRIIDVIRDALVVFGEALDGAGDAFEMLGFASVRRQHVRIQHLKAFDDAWDAQAQARIAAIRPGYYTRMGAAIREGTQRLARRPERQRLLLILTDGKPTDLDVYEGRYGLEDTRHAVIEARRAGLVPLAVTIDQHAHGYLPLLFGQQGFAIVRRPAELAMQLTRVYAQLTRGEHAG